MDHNARYLSCAIRSATPQKPTYEAQRTMIAVENQTDRPTTGIDSWTHEELVEKVRFFNPSASIAYLMTFDFSSLRLYLAHLEWARLPKKAVWHRPGDTRGIRVFAPAD